MIHKTLVSTTAVFCQCHYYALTIFWLHCLKCVASNSGVCLLATEVTCLRLPDFTNFFPTSCFFFRAFTTETNCPCGSESRKPSAVTKREFHSNLILLWGSGSSKSCQTLINPIPSKQSVIERHVLCIKQGL